MAQDTDRTDPGRVALTRRDALALLGASGTGLWLSGIAGRSLAQVPEPPAPTPGANCIVRPAQIEGPYFVDDKLDRSDIRSDPGSGGALKPGTPLELEFRVYAAAGPGCKPLSGVTVDVWHCDALGIYSDVKDPNFNTVGKRFLRGYQTTDAQGRVRFKTIYPGAYAGRAVHIHYKLRYAIAPERRAEFTSQVYFPDELNESVQSKGPYSTEGAVKAMLNEKDQFFQNDGGAGLVLDLRPSTDGFTTTFDVALQDIYPA